MDPFALLGLPRRYTLDRAELDKVHRELSRALHPDRYAAAPPQERQRALGRAVEVNEAHRILRDPVRRAEALFQLAGMAVGERSEPKASPALLMDVMELREELQDAKVKRNAERVRALAADVQKRADATEAALAAALDGPEGAALDDLEGAALGADSRDRNTSTLAGALPRLGELRFYRRFLEEVSAVEDELEGLA